MLIQLRQLPGLGMIGLLQTVSYIVELATIAAFSNE